MFGKEKIKIRYPEPPRPEMSYEQKMKVRQRVIDKMLESVDKRLQETLMRAKIYRGDSIEVVYKLEITE